MQKGGSANFQPGALKRKVAAPDPQVFRQCGSGRLKGGEERPHAGPVRVQSWRGRLQLTCSAEGPWKQNADDQSF